jgi:hypothetical protein
VALQLYCEKFSMILLQPLLDYVSCAVHDALWENSHDFVVAVADCDCIMWEIFCDFIADCELFSWQSQARGCSLSSSSSACLPSCGGVLTLYMAFPCGGLCPLLPAAPAPSCARCLRLKCIEFCSSGFISPANRLDAGSAHEGWQ